MTTKIIWVAGATASGKTTWIRDRIATLTTPCAYWQYGAQSHTIDASYLGYVCQELQVFHQWPDIPALTALAAQSGTLLVEVPAGEDLLSLPALPGEVIERVFVQPQNFSITLDWASTTVCGGTAVAVTEPLQYWDLSGEVLDTSSLGLLWTELTQGAYGPVQRVKALFETVEGYPLYFDFVAGVLQTDYEELEIERHLQGRPQRFSGLAAIGKINLAMLQQSLKDASLDDRLLEYYQSQMQQILSSQTVS